MRFILPPIEPRESYLRVCSIADPMSLEVVIKAVDQGLFTRQKCKIQGYLYLGLESFSRFIFQFQKPMRIWQGMGGVVSAEARNVVYVIAPELRKTIAVDPGRGTAIRWVALP